MIKKTAAVMAILAGISATGAQALSLKKGAQPAELPPAGYDGNSYVDSRGCIYIRAGVAGNVTWVPRVTRNREVVCGARPSLAAAQPAPVEAPVEAAAPIQSVTAVETPSNPTAPVQSTTVRKVPSTARTRVVPRPSKPGPALPPRIGFGPDETNPDLPPPSPAPRSWLDRYSENGGVDPSLIPSVAPVANLAELQDAQIVPDNGTVDQSVRVNCPPQANVNYVTLNGERVPLQCGSHQTVPESYVVAHGNGLRTRVTTFPHPSVAQAQSVAPYSSENVASVPATTVSVPQGNGHAPRSYTIVRRSDFDKSALPPSTVIAPQTYVASNMPVTVPEGYKVAWDDGRLNRLRGVRTVGGDLLSAQIWTEDPPRKLIGVKLPKSALSGAPIFGGPATEVFSTRSAPITSTQSVSAQPSNHRYVQVGGFANPSNARKVIIKLQKMGLTVSSMSSKSGVKTILAGPFTQQAQLTSALSKVRRAGFQDAFLRK
ncbi:SPOR domain-containing protein [Aliiroseovarius sp. KMU-50]|uniref:SPOR domain-containing protein n=1 Tax=Aliiroseovarius salicola TaxID=3009082 RepID=A0ABT4W553_9RHOB|nr:SPOR domain-containing protein [Aliiroseovarius sp. KMU-50]MDA5095648.1 SPOR domain-containing protein [Aliiroseovarius sp. KMU-50]